MDLAEKRRWSEAQSLADKKLETSFDPTLVLAAAMIHFCAGDHGKAGHLFEKALSMDDKNDQARFLLFLIDWMAGRSTASPYRHDLLNLDWRSPHEFFGYLVRILDGTISEDSALGGGYTDVERNWLRYAVALLAAGKNNTARAEKLLQPVVLETGRQNWIHFLALARLEQTQQHVLESTKDPEVRRQYKSQIDQFIKNFEKSRHELAERQAGLAVLRAKLRQDGLAPETKRGLLEKILETDSGNGNLLVQLVFYCTMDEDWQQALGSYMDDMIEYTFAVERIKRLRQKS